MRRSLANHARYADVLFAEDFEAGLIGEWASVGP